MSKPQGIRDGRGSPWGSLTRSPGALPKVATRNIGSRHSSTDSRNRRRETRSPARRPSGRLPSSLHIATAMRNTSMARTRDGFPSRVCCVAAGWCGRAAPSSRCGSIGLERSGFDFLGCFPTRLQPEECPACGFGSQSLGSATTTLLAGVTFQDHQSFRGAP